MNWEDIFNKPLEEVSDAELIEKAQELRVRRKYPSVDKAKDNKKDEMQKLIDKAIIQRTKKA